MSENKLCLGLIVLCLSMGFASAKDFWKERAYTDWSLKECEELLADSPWAHPYAVTRANIPGVMNSAGRTTPESSYGDANLGQVSGDREVRLYLRARFLTARPIKAAIGRMRILNNPKNRELEQQVQQYVSGPPGAEVVIELTYYSEPAGHVSLRGIENFLRLSTLPQLQNEVWLSNSSKDLKVPLGRYQPPTSDYPGALLFFPRYDKTGAGYFDGSEKQIIFRLKTNFGELEYRLKPPDMRFDSQFAF